MGQEIDASKVGDEAKRIIDDALKAKDITK